MAGVCAWWGACMVGGVHGGDVHAWCGGRCVWWGCAWWGGHMHGGGVCMVEMYAWQGACVVGETVTAADGTHPTGMLSCSNFVSAFVDLSTPKLR